MQVRAEINEQRKKGLKHRATTFSKKTRCPKKSRRKAKRSLKNH
jgi:hypothetical protein